MTTVAPAVSLVTTSEGPWTTGSFTPAVGDRAYLVLSARSSELATVVPIVTDTQNNSWVLRHTGSASDSVYTLVYECLSTSIARSMTVTVTAASGLGGAAIQVFLVSGYGKIRQIKSLPVTGGVAPELTFTATPLAGSCVIGVVASSAALTITEPAGFTEGLDSSFATPDLGMETAYLNGSPPETVTWLTSVATDFLVTIIEIEEASIADMDHFVQYGTDATYHVLRILQPLSNPWNTNTDDGRRPVCLSTPSELWSTAGTDRLATDTVANETRHYGCAVVFIQYRKRDATVWPEPLEDMFEGLQWLLDHASEYLLDAGRICATGDGAAATNVALLSLGVEKGLFGASNIPAGTIRSVLWRSGANNPRMTDPCLAHLGLTRAITGACTGGSVEDQLFNATPCSLGTFDWLSGDSGSLNNTPSSIYNLFSVSWLSGQYPGTGTKPVFFLWHGEQDDVFPYLGTSNPQLSGADHVLDDGFAQDLADNGFAVTVTLLPSAGHGGPQFYPPRVTGATNEEAVRQSIYDLLLYAGAQEPGSPSTQAGAATLNNRYYADVEFGGLGYVGLFPEPVEFGGLGYVGLFPEPVLADLLAQSATRHADTVADIVAQDALFVTQEASLALSGVFKSTTSLAVGTGSKAFVLTAPANLRAGWYVVFQTGTFANRMYVRLPSNLVSSTAFTVTSDIALGSGTFADWTIQPVTPRPRWFVSEKTGAYTLVAGDNQGVIKCTSGTFTVTGLAAATAGAGYEVVIVNSGGGTITFDPNAAELVDGASTITINAGHAALLVCTGTEWFRAASDVPLHDFTGTDHSVSGLTAGHILTASSGTAFAFAALTDGQMPTDKTRAVRTHRSATFSLFK